MCKELTNLWEETVRVLGRHELDFDKDVIQVQTVDGYIEKETFKTMAIATNYDAGYGSAKIREDLVIIGTDWWLERKEYDGKEWWSFLSMPPLTEKKAEVHSLLYCDED